MTDYRTVNKKMPSNIWYRASTNNQIMTKIPMIEMSPLTFPLSPERRGMG
jgi:hypothetical protein